MNSRISFYNEDIPFKLLHKRQVKSWLFHCVKAENEVIGEINIIFCSDEYLLQMNKTYLNHDYFTDIITFDNSDKETISGELYISVDRIRENAKTFHSSVQNEMKRVIVHGVLHLLGYKDKTLRQQKLMRDKEDYYLNLLPKLS